jgi:hypothetical protein
MLSGPYVMINQWIKSIWKASHLENSLLYMLGGKNINLTKNDQDWDFWKEGPNLVIQKKSIIIWWLKFLL